MEKYTVDRVIGTKYCLGCGGLISLEGYTIPEVASRLTNEKVCQKMIAILELSDKKCGHNLFSEPKFEVKMKQYKNWINPLMKRMSK